jgi:hypothetical protein
MPIRDNNVHFTFRRSEIHRPRVAAQEESHETAEAASKPRLFYFALYAFVFTAAAQSIVSISSSLSFGR